MKHNEVIGMEINFEERMANKHETMTYVTTVEAATAPPRAMKLISWNYHGLGNPWAVRALNKLIE